MFSHDQLSIGARFQFLNHGAGPDTWVASIQGAIGQREDSTTTGNSSSTSEAKSKIKTTQAGISLGYKLAHIVPYISYIHESHEVKTDVTNSHGSFGPYDDKGTHQYYSIGVASHGRGLTYGIEYNRINIDWERAESTKPQDALGLKLGFAW